MVGTLQLSSRVQIRKNLGNARKVTNGMPLLSVGLAVLDVQDVLSMVLIQRRMHGSI